MKGRAITLPHRRSYRVVALAQSGSICIFQQHYRAKAKKGRGTLAPAFCLFALKTRASTSVVTSRKQCAIANVSPRRQMRLCKLYRGRGFSEQVVHSEYALPGLRAFFYRLYRRWPGECSLSRGPQLNSHTNHLRKTIRLCIDFRPLRQR